MSSLDKKPVKKRGSMLDNSFTSALVVPIAIVLTAALIIFGVTKMISTDRSYKDLVREMQSKTFGNRWIAAYELSKMLNASKIPSSEMPWLIENLKGIYSSARDPRTKDFIIVALGSLDRPSVQGLLIKALNEEDKNIRFHAIIALGNLKKGSVESWEKVISFLDSPDKGLVQAAIYALATHRVDGLLEKFYKHLNGPDRFLRYSTGISLIYYKDELCLETLKEIAKLEPDEMIDPKGVAGLQLNLLNAAQKTNWKKMINLVKLVEDNSKNVALVGKARDVLKQLKN